jgi:hypothetical protein
VGLPRERQPVKCQAPPVKCQAPPGTQQACTPADPSTSRRRRRGLRLRVALDGLLWVWQEQQDHDELQEEYRLLKKLRNRKISEAEYEAGSEAIMDSHMDVAVKTDKKQTKAAKKKLEKNKRLLRHGR